MYFYIITVSIVLYIILQFLDDRRNITLHKPPSNTSSKVVLMFLSFILTTVAFYLFWDTSIPVDSVPIVEGGGEYSNDMDENFLGYIDEEINTGFPDF